MAKEDWNSNRTRCDWSEKFVSPSTNQMQNQNQQEFAPSFFPRFRQLTCFFSNFSLNPCDTFFCPDWLIDFYEFGSRLLTEIRLVLTILIFFMFLCNNVLSDLFKLEMGTLDFLELRYRVSSPRQNITLLLQIFFKLSTTFFSSFVFISTHLISSGRLAPQYSHYGKVCREIQQGKKSCLDLFERNKFSQGKVVQSRTDRFHNP